jgi:hypothetical protein
MTWIWRLEHGDGSTKTDVNSPAHLTQSDAETWLGENWQELLAQGVTAVTLFEDDRLEYGPMSLARD